MSETFKEMSLIDHLNDLRKFIWRSFMAILAGGVVIFSARSFVFDKILFAPIDPGFVSYRYFCKIFKIFCNTKIPIQLISRQLQGQFSVHIWTSVYLGIVIAFPYIIYEFWKFISPGLYEKEKRAGKKFVFITTFLFFTGVLFGYYVITPLVVQFLTNYTISDKVSNFVDIKSYISNVRTTILAVGLVFELPVIIYFLAKLGLITSRFMKENRKYAVLLILALSAIITPPDVFSQIMVSIPLLILYEISIYIAKMIEKKQPQHIKPAE